MPEAQVRPARCTGGRGNEAGRPHLQPLLLDPRALTFRHHIAAIGWVRSPHRVNGRKTRSSILLGVPSELPPSLRL